jgi:O-antigen/teichoic acid export membrane protein
MKPSTPESSQGSGVSRFTGLLRRAWFSQTLQNVGWVAAGTAVSGVLGAVYSAILARKLGVEDFGTLTLVVSFALLLTDLADLGFNSAVVKFGSERLSQGDAPGMMRVVSIVFRIRVFIGTGLILASIVFIGPLVRWQFGHVDSHLTGYLRFSLVVVALGILAASYVPVFQAYKQFRLGTLVSTSRALAKLVALLLGLAVALTFTVSLGIWLEVVALLVMLGFSWACSPLKRLTFKDRDRGLERRIVEFNKWIALYQVVGLLAARLDVFFVGGFGDATSLGIYGAASKISGLISLGSYSYMVVLMPELSASLSPEALGRKRRNSLGVIALLVLGIVMTAVFAPFLIRILFGPSFIGAAPVLQIMCLGLLCTVLAYPMTASLFAAGRSVVFPIMSAASLLAFIVVTTYLMPRLGVLGAALGYSAGGLATLIVSASLFFGLRDKSHPDA